MEPEIAAARERINHAYSNEQLDNPTRVLTMARRALGRAESIVLREEEQQMREQECEEDDAAAAKYREHLVYAAACIAEALERGLT